MVQRRRKNRTHLKGPNNSAATATNAPKSFIIRSGKVPKSVSSLVLDTRKVMEPNTATRLRERKSNKLKDFVTMAGPLSVTHMMIFGQTEAGTNLRIVRCPRGPTVTFRINKYALARDIQSSSRHPRAPGNEFLTPPLLVLNNFTGTDKHIQLLVTTFQNLFPPIHVHTMKLSQARRIVLIHYHHETKTIDWRHYLISVRPVGVSKAVRRVIEGATTTTTSSSKKIKKIPNLSNTNDIADYLLQHGSSGEAVEFETDASEAESETEDVNDSKSKVILSQRYVGRGNEANTQKAIRIHEIGPRMELRLVKIEEGIQGGQVLYHDYIHKTEKETARMNQDHRDRVKQREQRRLLQQANVDRKKSVKNPEPTVEGSSDQEEEQDQEEEEEEDEFEYEDQFGQQPEGEGDQDDEELFDDDEEDEEEEESDEESDLEPIAIGQMQSIESSDEEEQQEQPIKKRKQR